MAFQSFRDYLQVDEYGDLLKIDGADREEEIWALAETIAGTASHPMLLFDNIKGFPRRLSCLLLTRCPASEEWRWGLGSIRNFPTWILSRPGRRSSRPLNRSLPKKVKTGPVLENVFSGKDVDLLKFPAPKWHELDGGYYIGTGSCVFTREAGSRLGQYGCLPGGRARQMRWASSSTISITRA